MMSEEKLAALRNEVATRVSDQRDWADQQLRADFARRFPPGHFANPDNPPNTLLPPIRQPNPEVQHMRNAFEVSANVDPVVDQDQKPIVTLPHGLARGKEDAGITIKQPPQAPNPAEQITRVPKRTNEPQDM